MYGFNKENCFLKGVQLRHACKAFDTNKQIPQDDFNDILRVGHLAPSSFGMEPTRIIVVKNKQTRQDLRALCWNQEQITSASEVVIFKTLKTDLLAGKNYVKNNFTRKEKNQEAVNAYIEKFGEYQKNRGYDDYTIGSWAAHQSYISATSMMDYASYLGIDTCMIEGFDKKGIESYLKLDGFKEQVTLLLCFGYRIKEQQKRYRIDFDSFVEYK